MKCRYVAMVAALAATADVVLVHTVTPMSVGPLGILAFFVCLYIATASCCYLVMVAVKRIAMRVVQHNMYRGLASVTPLKLYYYASIIGGVTAWDILLLTLFLGLGCFYIHKRF